jgi:paraquat-inducible protein B
LKIALEVEELGSLKQGTPVLFRDIQVGEIEGHRLKKDNTGVRVDLLIYGKYASLVRENSRFWNVSGITVDASLSSGVRIRAESLVTIHEGGIAFETPFGDISEPAKNGTIFTLYDSYESATEKGIPITITFKSGEGLSVGSSIKYKGMDVGKVKNIELSESLGHVVVEALLDPSAANLAKEGTKFWVARPEIGLGGVSNLGAIISNYIEVHPGDGSPTKTFVGLEEAPLETDDKSSLKIVLLSDKLGSVSVGAPIYYRQVQVGKVVGHNLADTANNVEIHLSIDEKYAPLVRQNTKFWNVSGIGVDLYLFGVKAKTESLASLIKGGIAFATPLDDKMGNEVRNGMVFRLYDQPKKEWLAWAPVIQLNEDKIVEIDPNNDKTTKIDTTQNQVKSSTKRNRTSSREKHYGLPAINGRTY